MNTMNYQPICENPVDGCMTNGAGYRLCCNPKHKEDPANSRLGFFSPVWHPMSEWPEAKPPVK